MGEEYAAAGVDYRKLAPFKRAMLELVPQTLEFPSVRGVRVSPSGVVQYLGRKSHGWRMILESLGTKNWLAQWMYQKTGKPWYFTGIAADLVEMAVMDLLRQGALPVGLADLVAVHDGSWFDDDARTQAFRQGLYHILSSNRMALTGGETPALRVLVRGLEPVEDAPVFACAALGIIAPLEREIRSSVYHGAQIVGVSSSGPHANGYSLLIKRGLTLPDEFLHVLPETDRPFGEEALAPTTSYVHLMEALFDAAVPLVAVVPATGGGLGKLAADHKPYTYVIERWPEAIPPIFPFLLGIGVPLAECLSTFNWGIGFYLIVDETRVDRVLEVGRRAGYPLRHLGHVEDGGPRVVFQPAGNLVIYPPGD